MLPASLWWGWALSPKMGYRRICAVPVPLCCPCPQDVDYVGTDLSLCGLGGRWHCLLLPLGQCWWTWGLCGPQCHTPSGRLGGMLSIVSPHQVTLRVTLAVPGGHTHQAGGAALAGAGEPGRVLRDTQGQGCSGCRGWRCFFTRWQQRLWNVTLQLVAGPP